MQLKRLTKLDSLSLDQQQVIIDNTYMPPRRNVAFSSVPHTDANTIFLGGKIIGTIQNNPQSGSSEDIIPSGTGTAEHYWNTLPVEGVPINVTLTQSRATLNIEDDALNISHETVTQNVYANGEAIEENN